MKRLRRRFTKTGVAVVTVLAGLVVLAGVALAITVNWTGQGATGGSCNTVDQDPSVPAGQQRWLFILTQPDPGPWALTATFNPAAITPMPVSGVQQGQGSVHFTVFTPLGAQLVSASATNGSAQSGLRVSHCEVTPTTTTSTTTTTTAPTTTTTSSTTTTTSSTTTTTTSTTTTTAPTTTTTTTAPTTTTTTAPTTTTTVPKTTTTTAPTTTTTVPKTTTTTAPTTTTTVPKTTTTTAPTTTTTAPKVVVPAAPVPVRAAPVFTG